MSQANRIDRNGDNRPSAVLACDWNGTLVDDRERAWSATCAVLASRSLTQPSLPEFLAEWRLPLEELFAHYRVADCASAIEDWNRAMAASTTSPMNGAEDLLRRLGAAGVVVGVVTAASAIVIERDLASLGFGSDVVRFVYADANPKRDALAEIARTYSCHVAFVGDTEYDIREARAAGSTAFGFSGGYRPAAALLEAGANHVVERLEDVARLVLDGVGAKDPQLTTREEGALVFDTVPSLESRLTASEGGQA